MRLAIPMVGLWACVLAMRGFPQDAKFQALFVYNFAKCIEWPAENSKGDFVFSVLGKDAVYDELKTIAGKATLEDRKIVVHSIDKVDSIGACHILYVPPSKSDLLDKVLAKVGSSSTLVVTNKEGLGAKGAAINLIMIDGKQRYEINPEGLKRGGLVAKPMLVKLGKVLGT